VSKSKNRAGLARIREIAGGIAGLSKATLPAVSAAMGKSVRALISEGFDKRQAPDGKAWKEREQRQTWPLLEKTGKMRRGWRVAVSSKGLKTSNRTKHTKFHQDGTRNMVARPMVPSKGRRLPERWRIAILRSAKNAVHKELKRVISP
jgi:hypothetical protein